MAPQSISSAFADGPAMRPAGMDVKDTTAMPILVRRVLVN